MMTLAVQLSVLLLEHDEFLSNLKKVKNDIVQAEIIELGDAHGIYQVPPLASYSIPLSMKL